MAVAAGDEVAAGQRLGEVGNSGNTSEPHFHIHAVFEDTGDVFTGEAAPIRLAGRNPIRNTVFDW